MSSTPQLFRIFILTTFSVTGFLLWAQPGMAQDVEENFTTFPEFWAGDVGKFKATPGWLALQAPPENGEARLSFTALGSTPFALTDTLHWEFTLGMDFNPSSANFCRLLLEGNLADWSSFTGIYLAVGESGDALQLVSAEAGQTRILLQGEVNRLNRATLKLDLRVIRIPDGHWKLYSRTGPNEPWVVEGECQFSLTKPVLGLICRYTNTRSTKFYFEKVAFRVRNGPKVPPTGTLQVVDPRHLTLIFSEDCDTSSVISLEMGQQTFQWKWTSPRELQVVLARSLVNGVREVLRLQNLRAQSGLVNPSISFNVLYFQPDSPQPGDVVITELMIDPVPSQGLAEVEYVEIVNITQKTFSTAGWRLQTLSGTGQLDSVVLYPNQVAVLCNPGDTARFTSAVAVNRFPGLPNSGTVVTLWGGRVLDSLDYRQMLSKPPEGGVSLEKWDFTSDCRGSRNWQWALDPIGGTPGRPNSLLQQPQATAVELQQCLISGDTLSLQFSDALYLNLEVDADGNEVVESGNFSYGNDEHNVLIFVNNDLPELLDLRISGIRDCAGRDIPEQNCRAIRWTEAGSEIRISEILFNPEPLGSDFVELTHTGTGYVVLTTGSLRGKDGSKTLAPLYFEPGQIHCLCSDASWLRSHYELGPEVVITEMQLPSMPDESGTLVLSGLELIDSISYREADHHPLLREAEGVSLERVWSAGSSRWYSGTGKKYGSPCRRNDSGLSGNTGVGTLVIDPEVTGTRGDDQITIYIKYNFNKPNYIFNLTIYSSSGEVIDYPVRGYAGGTTGVISWFGADRSHRRVVPGAYMVEMEVYNGSGLIDVVRKPFYLFPFRDGN